GRKSKEAYRLILHYLRPDLTPLEPELAALPMHDFDQELFNLALLMDPAKVFLLPRSIAGRNILLPGIIADGIRPRWDRSSRENRNPELSRGTHAYFFEPFSKDKTLGFRTRVVDSDLFVSHVREQMDLRFYDDIEPVHALSHGGFLFRLGQLDNAQPMVVQLTSASEAQWRILNVKES